MNNLGFLRKSLKLTYRALEAKCGVDRTTLNNLEVSKTKFTEDRINKLCNFFAVTSDFLLGKTDFGIYLNLSNGFVTINKKDYQQYKADNLIIETIVADVVNRVASTELEKKIDPLFNEDLKKEIMKEIQNLSKKELEKVMKFIREFIK